MFSVRVVVDLPQKGRTVVFTQIFEREQPKTGNEIGFSPGMGEVSFDWSQVIDFQVVGVEANV